MLARTLHSRAPADGGLVCSWGAPLIRIRTSQQRKSILRFDLWSWSHDTHSFAFSTPDDDPYGCILCICRAAVDVHAVGQPGDRSKFIRVTGSKLSAATDFVACRSLFQTDQYCTDMSQPSTGKVSPRQTFPHVCIDIMHGKYY